MVESRHPYPKVLGCVAGKHGTLGAILFLHVVRMAAAGRSKRAASKGWRGFHNRFVVFAVFHDTRGTSVWPPRHLVATGGVEDIDYYCR